MGEEFRGVIKDVCPLHSQTGPCHTQTGSLATQTGPSYARGGPCPTQADPRATEADPSNIRRGSCPTQTGLPYTETVPSHLQITDLCPIQSSCGINVSYHDKAFEGEDENAGTSSPRADPCPSQADHYTTQKVPVLAKIGCFSTQRELLPTQTDTRFSHIRVSPTQANPYPTQSKHCSDNTGQYHTKARDCMTQAEPSQAHAGPSYSQNEHKLKSFECKICKKLFKTKWSLDRHNHEVHEEDPDFFECDHCGRHFLRRASLLEHIKAKHLKSKRDHLCSKCGKAYSTSSLRNRHIRYNCPSVKKQSLLDADTLEPDAVEPGPSTVPAEQPSDLDNASCKTDGVSVGRKLHGCPNCGRKYFLKRSLYRHQRYECGVPPSFSCSMCSYKAHHKSRLKKHFKTHGCNE